MVFHGPDDERFARWETHTGAGPGVRPVRVMLPRATSSAPTIVRYSRELVAALAPPSQAAHVPAPAARGLRLTTLTAVGSGAATVYRYWDNVLPALSELGLRRLVCEVDWTETKELLWQLEKRRAVDGLGFACPALEELAVQWHLPARLDFSVGGGDWEELRGRDQGRPRGLYQDDPGLAGSLRTFCDTVRACLKTRAEGCGRLRRLEVMPCPWSFDQAAGVVLQGWQTALVEERLRDKLGDFVGDIVVVGGLQW